MLAFWLDPAAAFRIAHPRGYVTGMEAQLLHFLGPERRIVRPLGAAPLLFVDGGKHDVVVGRARWGLIPDGTPKEGMRTAALQNLVVRGDRAATHPATEPIWARSRGGERNQWQCLVPMSGWLVQEPKGVVAYKLEHGFTTMAGLFQEVFVDGRAVLTFTLLIEEVRTTYSDRVHIYPIAIGELRRMRWLGADNPRSAAWVLNEGATPVDWRYVRRRRHTAAAT